MARNGRKRHMKKQDAAVATPSSTVLVSGALPDPAAIPAVPEGDKPLDGVAKNALLKVASEQRAEVDQAMEQLWTKRAELKQDLGTLTPDADKARRSRSV